MLHNLLGFYAVQFAGALLPLLTLPYLARVLGPSNWGLAIFFQTLGLWLSVMIEYGFNLSGAREVARARKSGQPLGGIIAAVMGAKLMLAVACFGFAGFLTLRLPPLAAHPGFVGWTLLYAAALGFSPFWYFQGIERIPAAAAVETGVRVLAAGGTFLCVRGPDDGATWMALQSLAAAASTGITLVWMLRETGCQRLRLSTAVAALRDGLHMTFFRASTTLSTSVNILVLGWLGLPATVGYFAGAEKLARAEAALLAPVAQTTYPRISWLLLRSVPEARALAQRATVDAALAAAAGALSAALVAPFVIRLALGSRFAASVVPFQVLQICVPLVVLRHAIGMNWLLPMRLERAAGAFVLAGLAVNAVLAAYLAQSGGATGIAWAVVLAELFVLLGCLWLAWRPSSADFAKTGPVATGQEEYCR